MHLDDAANGDEALAVVRERLDTGEGDATARQSLRRHYEHLEALAASLRKLGMDEREVGENILMVFCEYERELAHYINAMSTAEGEGHELNAVWDG
jgi:hypothetical protein